MDTQQLILEKLNSFTEEFAQINHRLDDLDHKINLAEARLTIKIDEVESLVEDLAVMVRENFYSKVEIDRMQANTSRFI